jgi:hypothetical protein
MRRKKAGVADSKAKQANATKYVEHKSRGSLDIDSDSDDTTGSKAKSGGKAGWRKKVQGNVSESDDHVATGIKGKTVAGLANAKRTVLIAIGR